MGSEEREMYAAILKKVLSGKLDQDRQFRYTKWLLEQARSAELAALNKTWFVLKHYWTDQYDVTKEVHDTSRQQTGMMLMESIDELRRAGLLNDDYSLKNPNFGKAFKYYRLAITETQGSYDIMLGSWKLIGENAAGIPSVSYTKKESQKTYNLLGQPVENSSKKTILIKNNKKYIAK